MKIRQFSLIILSVLAILCVSASAQRLEINIPDIDGYKTLKCDFHIHTVFSDGSVWPTVRVDEAWREGLDAIAMTDHIEYQPHKKDLPTNHNRPYEIASGHGKGKDILVIHGAEITRGTPPGHFNAIFLDDVNPLDTKEFLDCMNAAKKQNAFVFWNHPNWKARDGKQYIFDIHQELYDKGLIAGVEVLNGSTYDKGAHKWALERNLTLMGDSDIHRPSDPPRADREGHRTVTLVFSAERSIEAIKDALVNRRTAIWFDNNLVGDKSYLEQIMDKSITIGKPFGHYKGQVSLQVHNSSDISYELISPGRYDSRPFVLPARGTVIFKTSYDTKTNRIHRKFEVRNLITAPDKYLAIDVEMDAR